MSRTRICTTAQLTPGLGAAALLEGNRQVALFRLHAALAGDAGTPGPDGTRYVAVDNIDPYTGAAVMSRGIVGETDGRPTIASPLLKQKFFLDTGASLQGDDKALACYDVSIDDDVVYVEA
ncbi:nitrite reductase (NAD(P)H) small subunit [Corynebacterium uterequi]|uniref:Ferredoxin subunit of nitrite reductase and ring-hydroxylating dioxygenase n=1 Tax=Corynebacterium uterequi TaxID=1072256 RepID=A0A0G3HAF9_9CORY|nr:nitrite reductase (NAD(P)H) small subunit [Corynebacterium uterequi]AKK10356.1 ferredoxin subunit of nitrite reductase and ring-hydroxylating dioxygenase [Corynebacterium uterequi]